MVKDGADELMQRERYRWRARTGWSIAWGEWRDLALSNTMGRSPSGCGHACQRPNMSPPAAGTVVSLDSR